MSCAARGAFAAFAALFVLAASAAADTGRRGSDSPPGLKLGYFSQQVGRSQVRIGASIAVKRETPGQHQRSPAGPVSHVVRVPPKGGAVDDLPDVNPYPPLRADSSLARNPRPFGPESFWYPAGPGRVCIYAPGSVLPCYTLVGPGGGPGVDPAAIAASVADRLSLFPGRIRTSPVAAGLTGTGSWFWLEPGPRSEELTVSLAGERVTVVAQPDRVEWRFGDGAGLAGGAGMPYRAGPPPAGAIVHKYETRCLPGDQGRNPYVLASCGSSGYSIEAVIVWRIAFSARGRIEASGTLPSRTTEASRPYAVSEARGFLVSGGSR